MSSRAPASKRYPTNQRRERGMEYKPKSPDGIWLDRRGNDNNWNIFREQFTNYASKVYGDLSEELGADQDIQEDIEEPPGAAASFGYKMGIKRLEIRLKRAEDRATDRPKLFGDILCHICLESERVVKEHANFEAAYEAKSPRLLWEIVEETHITPQHAGDMGMWFQRNKIYSLRQGSMRIQDYSRMFREEYEKLLAIDGEMPQPTAAQVYLISLNGDTFSSKVADWTRDGEIPQTLEGAISLATNWFSTQSNAKAAMANHTKLRSSISSETAYSAFGEQVPDQGKKVGLCPICQRTANHRIENCWELGKLCDRAKADRDNKKIQGGSKTGVEPSGAYDAKKKKRGLRGKKRVSYSHSFSEPIPPETAWIVKLPHQAYIKRSGDTITIIDSGASVSIWEECCPLSRRYKGAPTTVHGLDGYHSSSDWGTHPLFGEGLIIPGIKVNLVSLSAISKFAKVEYSAAHNSFKVSTGDATYYFNLNGDGLYQLQVTRPERVHALKEFRPRDQNSYTRREVQNATTARQMCGQLGHIGSDGLIRVIKSGSLINLPISERDVRRAEAIFGPCHGCAIGKGTKSNENYLPHADIEPRFAPEDTPENLHADFVYIPGPGKTKSIVFISVGETRRLVIATKAESRSTEDVKKAWDEHLAPYVANKIVINKVTTDNEASLGASKPYLASLGIKLFQHASSQHEPHIERRVRTIKERMRAINSDLPYNLPARLQWNLLVWAIQGLNITPDTLSPTKDDVRSARERVTGERPNSETLTLSFGAVVLYHTANHADSNTAPRNHLGIVVGRNLTSGVHTVWNPHTRDTVARRSLRSMVATDALIATINDVASKDKANEISIVPLSATDTLGETPNSITDPLEDEPNQIDSEASSHEDDPIITNTGDPADDDSVDDEPAELPQEHPTQPDINQAADDTVVLDNVLHQEPAVDPPEPARVTSPYSLRPRKRQNYKDLITAHAHVQLTVKEAISQHKASTVDAITKEFQNLLAFDVFTPVARPSSRALPSKMFIKLKEKADGTFDKIKARLVAGGHRQTTDEECSSPTIPWELVQAALATSAQENLKITVCDIPAAYLHACRKQLKTTVHMTIGKEIAPFLIALKPAWGSFVNADGTITVVLHKALYGLKESGLLWYNHLSTTFRKIGLLPSSTDKCLFICHRSSEQPQLKAIALVHVDDILILTSRSDTHTEEEILNHLKTTYGDLPVHHDTDTISFVGVSIARNRDGITISCPGAIQKLGKAHDIAPKAATPTPSNYSPKISGESLNDEDAKTFHSLTMSLMYVAKRCRPDVLINAAVYSTKINNPTKADLNAARRTVSYLLSTQDVGITYRKFATATIELATDASYNCHVDSRSHSGISVFMSGGPVASRSVKQKGLSKSSCEAEIKATDEGLDSLLYLMGACAEMGFKVKRPVRVLQDNQSTIFILNRGHPTKKRAPIKVRYEYVKEIIDEGVIKLEYVPTCDMPVDILTKFLHGENFRVARDRLLNLRSQQR